MKKWTKRIMAVAFSALMVISLIPAKPVSAASVEYPRKVTAYAAYGNSTTISVGNLPKGVRLKNVKSSDTDVVSITNIGYNTYKYDGKTMRDAYIQYKARNKGKANITFKVNNSKKTVKVTVKPYVNPVKSVEIFGVKVNNSTNLKDLTKKWDSAYIDLNGSQKSKTIKVTAAKGWKVASIGVWSANEENSDFNAWKGGGLKSSRTAKVKLPGKGTYCVYVDMYNQKAGGFISLQYLLYY